jgi:hypothetical protein
MPGKPEYKGKAYHESRTNAQMWMKTGDSSVCENAQLEAKQNYRENVNPAHTYDTAKKWCEKSLSFLKSTGN